MLFRMGDTAGGYGWRIRLEDTAGGHLWRTPLADTSRGHVVNSVFFFTLFLFLTKTGVAQIA
jgi:hypothetical protein